MELIISIRKILRRAIKFGGSSIRDFRSADGTLGNFQSNFRVYFPSLIIANLATL